MSGTAPAGFATGKRRRWRPLPKGLGGAFDEPRLVSARAAGRVGSNEVATPFGFSGGLWRCRRRTALLGAGGYRGHRRMSVLLGEGGRVPVAATCGFYEISLVATPTGRPDSGMRSTVPSLT